MAKSAVQPDVVVFCNIFAQFVADFVFRKEKRTLPAIIARSSREFRGERERERASERARARAHNFGTSFFRQTETETETEKDTETETETGRDKPKVWESFAIECGV